MEAGLPDPQGGAVARHAPIWRRQVSGGGCCWCSESLLTQPAYESLGHQSHVPQVPDIRVKVIEHRPVGPSHHTKVELSYVFAQRQEPGSPATPLLNLRHLWGEKKKNTAWRSRQKRFFFKFRIGKETHGNLLRRRLLAVRADQMAVAPQPGQVLQ